MVRKTKAKITENINIETSKIEKTKSGKEIQAGDVVQLKSGSPLMTVGNISADICHCIFFEGYTLEERKIHIKSLNKVR